METTKVNTRFMSGNKTDEVYELLNTIHTTSEIMYSKIDWCDSIFSDGFIRAIEQDNMMPILNSEELNHTNKFGGEYHHVINSEDDECYVVYFREMTEEEANA